jgi:flagellar biogenesis protein FliO
LEIFAIGSKNSAVKKRSDGTLLNWRGVTAAIFARLHRSGTEMPRLAVLGRVNIAPKQSVALIEVEGERLLVGTSQDRAPRLFRLSARHQDRQAPEEIPLEGTVA